MNIAEYIVPSSLKEAHQMITDYPEWTILAGGAWIKQLNKDTPGVIDLQKLALNCISENDDCIEIGAMTSLRDLETSVALNGYASGMIPCAMKVIMGVAFRNIATIGGSIMGRYAFSDILTPLLALNATLVFYPEQEMTLETFLNQPLKTRELLVKIKLNKNVCTGYFKKVSNTHLDFSQLNVAIMKDSVQGFRIALGARPSVATLAHQAMDYLNQQKTITDDVLEKVASLVIEELKFGSNARASKIYREELARSYVKRGIIEVNK